MFRVGGYVIEGNHREDEHFLEEYERSLAAGWMRVLEIGRAHV